MTPASSPTPRRRRVRFASASVAMRLTAVAVVCATRTCRAWTTPSSSANPPAANRRRSYDGRWSSSARRGVGGEVGVGVEGSALHLSAQPVGGSVGNTHGESSCFLPLLQNDEEYIAPRIVQIAGAYPGITAEEYFAVSSEPPAELGQWEYDFSDPDGPQMGTVAVPGQVSVYECEDPVVVIADHFSMNVQLPPALVDPVDLVVLCDRAKTRFAERKFLVLDGAPGAEDGRLTIAAFATKAELPEGARILGRVELVQIPWLTSMKKTRSGFSEEDELF